MYITYTSCHILLCYFPLVLDQTPDYMHTILFWRVHVTYSLSISCDMCLQGDIITD